MPQLGDLSPAGSVAIGIIVGLLSTTVQSIGLTLQRKSHLLEDSKEDDLVRRPAYRRRRWQVGMFLFVSSNLIGSTIQITTLPLPVLSTLQASGLVFNTICATLILGEPFTKWSLFGTVLVAGGAILIAMFGALPEPSHSLDQLLELLGREQFILWMISTFIVMLLILVAALLLGRLHPENSPRLRFWRGMCFGSLSGVLSAHSLLVAKSAVELLVRTITSHSNQFNRWQSWAILLLLVFFALTQLYFLHRGLKLCSTSVLYPFVFCIYNIIAILDGLIYFRQTSRLPALHAGLIAVGTAILLSGVLALSWRLDDNGDGPPPADAHTLLTPGMSIVEDTTTESDSDEPGGPAHSPFDLESAPQTERTPLLGPPKHRQRFASTPSDTHAIWSELQDDAPTSPQSQRPRRASTMPRPPNRRSSSSASDEQQDGASDAGPTFPRVRARTMDATVQGNGSAGAWRERERKRRRWGRRHRSVSTPLERKRGSVPGLGRLDGAEGGSGEEAHGGDEARALGERLSGWWGRLAWWRGTETDPGGGGAGVSGAEAS